MNDFVAKARSTMLWDNLQASVAEVARMRAEAEEIGEPMPDDVRATLDMVRNLLHGNGIPWSDIDATPGLQP